MGVAHTNVMVEASMTQVATFYLPGDSCVCPRSHGGAGSKLCRVASARQFIVWGFLQQALLYFFLTDKQSTGLRADLTGIASMLRPGSCAKDSVNSSLSP